MKTSDARRALEFVREYCVPATAERFVPQAVEGLFGLISCDATGCGWLDRARGESSAIGYPAAYFTHEANQRGIGLTGPQLTPRMQPGRFMRFSEFFSRAQFHDSAMYHEHFRPRSVEDVMGMGFGGTRGVSHFFTLERGRVFSDRDQDTLNAVAGSLQAALANAHMLSELGERNAILEATLQAVGWNGLVVSAHERVLLESPQARNLLVYHFGRDGSGDRLPDSLLRWMRACATRQRQLAAPAQSTPFCVARGGRRLVIRMLLHPSGYMLLLEEDDDTPTAARLRSLGISEREAEVLSFIAEGKTGLEISILLGIRHDTVRKHTGRIFEKLGVETRTAAAAMALETTLAKRRLG